MRTLGAPAQPILQLKRSTTLGVAMPMEYVLRGVMAGDASLCEMCLVRTSARACAIAAQYLFLDEDICGVLHTSMCICAFARTEGCSFTALHIVLGFYASH